MTAFRKVAAAGATLAMAATLAACASSDREAGDSDASAFTFGAAGAPKLFDPFYATDGETFRVTRQMMEGLLGVKDGTAEVIPELATEWESTKDGLDWTFTLRDDVTFHDGEKFDAQAVCDNMTRMFEQPKDAQSAAEYWAYTMGYFSDKAAKSLYKGCEVVDDTHVTISINRFTSDFPTMLSLEAFSMQSPKAMEEGDANGVKPQGEGFVYPDYSMNAVGTGPYQLDSHDASTETTTLKRFDDYWGDAAKTDELVFKAIPDESTRRSELQAGSINGYDLPNPVDWQGLSDEGNQVEVRPAFNVLYVGLNPATNDALKDLKVRQAIYHALNREQLVSSQLPEGAEVATQFMPSTVTGWNEEIEPYAYDPDKAKQLLAEAGQEDLELQFALPTEVTRPYMPNPQAIHDALRTDLEAVGITVETVSAPWNGGYLDNVLNHNYDAYLLGWTGDYDSANNFIGTFFADESNDFSTYTMPWGKQLTKELHAADGTVDDAEREQAYKDLNRKIMEAYLPGLPISHSPPAIVVGGDVEGLVASPLTAETFDAVTVGGK